MERFLKNKMDNYDSIITLDYIIPLFNGEISIQEIPYIKVSVIDRIVSKLGNMTSERFDMIESLKTEMQSM